MWLFLSARPPSLDEAGIVTATALLRDGKLTIAEIADRVDVAPSTIYKHLPEAAFNDHTRRAGLKKSQLWQEATNPEKISR